MEPVDTMVLPKVIPILLHNRAIPRPLLRARCFSAIAIRSSASGNNLRPRRCALLNICAVPDSCCGVFGDVPRLLCLPGFAPNRETGRG